MKHYSTQIIREFTETHKNDIDTVECGMREDWSWTAETVYSNGDYDIDMNGTSVTIAGIDGSYWATPIMEVTYKDGRREIVDCYLSDNDTASSEEISRMKQTAIMTGGMDCLDGGNE